MVEHEAQDNLEQALAARTDLQRLLRSEGWARLAKIAEEQIVGRRDKFELSPLKAMDEVLEEQFMKGEISGIRFILALPETSVETLTATIDALNADLGNEDDNE